MNAEVRERLMTRLIRVEGKRNRMYQDHGVPHIGIGHNLRDKSISDRAVGVIFEDDINDTERDVERELPWVAALSLPRQAVVLEMAYNLGISGLLGFEKALAAIQAEQWDLAGKEIWASDAAKQTGGQRYRDLANQMRTGEWGG